MRSLFAGRAALLLGIFAGWGSAQTFPFQLRVSSTNNTAVVPNGSSIGFSSSVGQSQAVRLTATYTGFGKVTVSQTPQLFGSADFTATLGGAPPITLNSGDSVIVDLLYKPTTATGANAQFSLPFTETISATSPPTVSQNQISLNLQGTAPSFVLSYILQSDLNVVPLQPGGTVPFPDTLINTTSQANVNVTNVGSGTGQITDVTLTGSGAFKLVGKPLLPVSVAAGQQLQLLIRYQPLVVGSDSAQVQISFNSGSPVTANLQGNAVSPVFSYNLIQADQTGYAARPHFASGYKCGRQEQPDHSGEEHG